MLILLSLVTSAYLFRLSSKEEMPLNLLFMLEANETRRTEGSTKFGLLPLRAQEFAHEVQQPINQANIWPDIAQKHYHQCSFVPPQLFTSFQMSLLL